MFPRGGQRPEAQTPFRPAGPKRVSDPEPIGQDAVQVQVPRAPNPCMNVTAPGLTVDDAESPVAPARAHVRFVR